MATNRSSRTPEQRDADDARELELVARIRRGDPDAWAELLEGYQDRLHAVCFRMVHHRELAADLTQDAMVKIIQGLESYDGRSKLSTWMIRVTMNVCLSKLRSEKLRRHASIDGMRERPGGDRFGEPFEQSREPSAASGVEEKDRQQRLAEALGRLSPEQRAILILRDARGLDYEQIAEVMDLALGTVKSRLFRARAALREAIEALEAGPADRDPSAGSSAEWAALVDRNDAREGGR